MIYKQVKYKSIFLTGFMVEKLNKATILIKPKNKSSISYKLPFYELIS